MRWLVLAVLLAAFFPGRLVAMNPGLAGMDNHLVRAEVPAVAERGVYLNIASPVPPLTVHDWDEKQWGAYLDQLLVARLNRLYFYLWQDVLSDYPESSPHHERNHRLHERLRWMIPEAQRRGLKVTFLFCPTFLPRDLWAAHPELHADIEYVKHGFPCVCPSKAESWPLMEAIYGHELEWFKAADGFQIWFYDPGGCMCAKCSADLPGPLVKQVEVFSRLIREKNPQAEIQVSMWPIWLWEVRLQRTYGLDLLDRLRALFGPEHESVAIVDSAETEASFLRPAQERGFRTQAFMFSTNVETPFIFANPQLTYLRDVTARIAAQGFTGGFCHCIEPGSKFLNTFLAARSLWDPRLSAEDLAREAALWLTAQPSAAEILTAALLRWDAFLYNGATAAEGREIRRQVDEALSLLPAARRESLEWLSTTARALEVLGQGVESREDPQRQASLAAELCAVLAASPTFQNFAAQSEAEFPHLVRWVGQGWQRERF